MNPSRQSPQIERVEMDELVCWRVRTDAAELLVAQQGAQVLSYQRDGQPPLIWLSEQAGFRKGQSVRGGIPVCWPWFGDLTRNPLAVQAMRRSEQPAPAHGEVRGLDWELLGANAEEGAVRLEFAFIQPEGGLPDWPHPVALTLAIQLDEHLTLTLTSHNQGNMPVSLTQALHSYFAVSDIHQVRVEGLTGKRYIETLENWQERHQDSDLRFTGETDRIYLDTPARIAILDPGWQRSIQLEASGSHSAVVWNPWIDKARRLSQFADDAWQRMLCIETANLLDDAVHLAPGERHSLTVSLWSEALAN
ncbi:D-hexose-6-phosphate mutarotase [Pseudomonas indica]|uniref:D-hexose-6-phosphate mutarotase n=1 Tax=Pseudomonas indica TaxID=137658 RepID=UPI003FCF6D81